MARINEKTKKIVGMAMLTALVIILQLLCTFIKAGPFVITLVLVPMAIGASLYGTVAGGWLGFVFGVVVLFSGDAGVFLSLSVPGTIITVLLKGTLAGVAAGLVYKLISKKHPIIGSVSAALVCPIVNTGVFLLGCLVFFLDSISNDAMEKGFADVGTYMMVAFVGMNFLIELGVSIVFAPVIVRLIKVAEKRL